jgi:hypothetical protein
MATMAESLVLASVLVGSIVGSAFAQTPAPAPAQAPTAQDCPAMIKNVRDRVANRFDAGRYNAQVLASQAEALHREDKVADCLAKVDEAHKAAGLAMAK